MVGWVKLGSSAPRGIAEVSLHSLRSLAGSNAKAGPSGALSTCLSSSKGLTQASSTAQCWLPRARVPREAPACKCQQPFTCIMLANVSLSQACHMGTDYAGRERKECGSRGTIMWSLPPLTHLVISPLKTAHLLSALLYPQPEKIVDYILPCKLAEMPSKQKDDLRLWTAERARCHAGGLVPRTSPFVFITLFFPLSC